MRNPIAPFIFPLFLIGVLSINLACGSQNQLVEQQKGEIDYLTRENEELHRLLAQKEEQNNSSDDEVADIQSQSRVSPPSSLVLQAETISDEKSIESSDEVVDQIVEIEKPEIQAQEASELEKVSEIPVAELPASEIMPDLPATDESVGDGVVVGEVVEEIEKQDEPKEQQEELVQIDPELPSSDSSETEEEISPEEEADIIVESSQAPSYVDQPELYEENSEIDEDISEEEAERIAWANRPRQRPQAPIASLSTRQFFEDGTADLTRSAKIYLKLVATILSKDHKDSVIEIESQDIDDEPELLSDRLNTVLQELELKMPGFLDRVILLDTPLTYSNSRKVEDPHHIKFYTVKLGDQ